MTTISFTVRQDRLYSKKKQEKKLKNKTATGTELSDKIKKKGKKLCNSVTSLNVLRLSTAYQVVWRVNRHHSQFLTDHILQYVTFLIIQAINLTGLNSLDLNNYLSVFLFTT